MPFVATYKTTFVRLLFRGIGIFLPFVLLPLLVAGKSFPLKFYTSGNGLISDYVSKVVADSRGFLWFCTSEGLSRFDGYGFTNYTQENGLPHREVTEFMETKDGDYLIGTSRGLVAFNPLGRSYRWNIVEDRLEQDAAEPPLFKTHVPNDLPDRPGAKNVESIVEDGNGNLLVSFRFGIYRVEKSTDGGYEFHRFHDAQFDRDKIEYFGQLFTDSRGDTWLGVGNVIYRIRRSGAVEKIAEPGSNHFFEDRDGRIWASSGGNDFGIRTFAVEDDRVRQIAHYSTKDGLKYNKFAWPVAQDADGRIFITSSGILYEFRPEASGSDPKFRELGRDGVSGGLTYNGAIWFTFMGNGIARYSPNSFYVVDKSDGLPDRPIDWIFGNKEGEVFLSTSPRNLVRISNDKIEDVSLPQIKERYWTRSFVDLQSRDGEFWLTSTNGLFRFPKSANFADLGRTSPKKTYSIADGLFSNSATAIFEDSRGDIWVCALSEQNTLIRWERATEKIHRYTFEMGLPTQSGPVSFGEDKAGNVWIGFYFGQLVRFKDGRFREFTKEGLIQPNFVNQFLSDDQGRLWLATSSRGLFHVDDPDAETPVFANFSTANGLSSNQTHCLIKDEFGRLYAGTGRGISRVEPDLQRIKIFTLNDGLPTNSMTRCYADAKGNLWFAAINWLVRFRAEGEATPKPPPIFIESLSANGKARAISTLGEKELKESSFDSDERQIQIGFFSISFDAGENLRYQYKLNDQEWSDPSERRSVELNLSPGTYDFSVRAITSTGVMSENAATVTIAIARPVWQRWWFVLLALLTVGGAVFALDRYRVGKTRQVEKALSENRRANALLRESESRFRTLADTASDAIMTIDSDSTIIFANEAIEKVFGHPPSSLIGKPMTVLMPERMRGGHDRGLARYLLSNERRINWEGVALPGLHKDGHEIPLEVSFGEFERDGKRYFTGIARDVSERKRAEEALQRAREEKFRELQRVRTRIATDLHDDIGSSLTQIAVLTEVARGQATNIQAENLATPLERIKGISKELVSVMSDIVWAINPAKDNLPDLVQRMRRFGSDVFSGKDIKFEFYTPDIEQEPTLGANIRRELFAIYKEAVNNAAKYAQCTEASVTFQIDDDLITLQIRDDGKGFDTDEVLSEDFKPEMGGNGLLNIRRRVADLGGTCRITSAPGLGTTIELEVPLHLTDPA